MATYTAEQFVGKTIFITNRVPYYDNATHAGDNKPSVPAGYFNNGDQLVVKDYLNKNGVYTKWDDNYWVFNNARSSVPSKTSVVAFSDIAGNYNQQSTIKEQGLKSDQQLAKEKEDEKLPIIEKLLKKYGLYLLGTGVLIAFIKSRK
jgi:hypothetical protein